MNSHGNILFININGRIIIAQIKSSLTQLLRI